MKAILSAPQTRPWLADLPNPVGNERLALMTVLAAALTNLDVAVARGRHYFSSGTVPSIVGREAVAVAADGKRFFLNAVSIPAPFGSMAERTLADPGLTLPVPDGVPDGLAAALGNAGLAAWLPLSWRARMRPGETVLVLGATGVTGGIAIAAAKRLGAGRVVALGRNPDVLERLLGTGADAVVRLDEAEDLAAALQRAAGGKVDVVLDYLNGAPAEAALTVMANGGRMVQIGSPLAPGIMLHAQTGRRASLDVLGFAYYHAPVAEQASAYRQVCAMAMAGAVDLPIFTLGLERFGEAWDAQVAGSAARHVIVP